MYTNEHAWQLIVGWQPQLYIQYHYTNLIRKLLTLGLSEQLQKYSKFHTHNAIADNPNAMDLPGSNPVSEVWKQCLQQTIA